VGVVEGPGAGGDVCGKCHDVAPFGVLPVDGRAVEASSVEVSTNCCIYYKHAYASFVPRSGTFLHKFQFYWM
jgi:hypothetical protein